MSDQALGSLGGSYNGGYAINNAGQVAGFGATAGDAETHALLYDGTTTRDIGTLGGTFAQGSARALSARSESKDLHLLCAVRVQILRRRLRMTNVQVWI